MSRQVGVYRRLLRVYPSAFRDEYGEEMTRLFADQLAEARSTGGRAAVPILWVRVAVDLASTAPRQHLGRERPMAQSVDGPVVEIDQVRHVNRVPRLVLRLLPLWVFLAPRLVVQAASDPFFDHSSEVAELPLCDNALGL